MIMAGTDDTNGSLLKSQIHTEDGPCQNYRQAQKDSDKTQRLRGMYSVAGLKTYWNSEDKYKRTLDNRWGGQM